MRREHEVARTAREVVTAVWRQKAWLALGSFAFWVVGDANPRDTLDAAVAAVVTMGALVSLIPVVTTWLRVGVEVEESGSLQVVWGPRHTKVLHASAMLGVVAVVIGLMAAIGGWLLSLVFPVSQSALSAALGGPFLSTALARLSPSVVARAVDDRVGVRESIRRSRRGWLHTSVAFYAAYLSCELVASGARSVEAWLPHLASLRVLSAVADAFAILAFSAAWSLIAGKQYRDLRGINGDGSSKLTSDDS